MKKLLTLSAVIALVVGTFLIDGCSKGEKVASITEWENLHQQYFKLSFTHPKGWSTVTDAGMIAFYSSPEAVKKFTDPYADAPLGSQLMIVYRKMDTLRTLEQEVDTYVKGLKDQGFTIKAQEDKQLVGQAAKLVSYGGKLNPKVRLDVMRVLTIKDSVLYFIQFSSFNEFFEAHKIAFDSALASLKINEPKPAGTQQVSEVPSPETDTFENDRVRLTHPANFDVNIPPPKKDIQFSLEVRGVRRDCTVQLDMRAAQGLSIDKVVEQNSKTIKATSRGEGKIDGMRAPYFVYSPMKNIKSRIYFVVKNDKFYRIIMNYFTPMENDFLPAFERIIGSIRLK